jgi:hypothetical protein
MDFVVDIPVELPVEFNIAVGCAHHITKGSGFAGNGDVGAVKDGGRLIYTITAMTEQDAELFGIDREERLHYIRIDKGKVSVSPPTRKTKWLELVGVRLGNINVNPARDTGDEIQTVRSFDPPAVWDGCRPRSRSKSATRLKQTLAAGGG